MEKGSTAASRKLWRGEPDLSFNCPDPFSVTLTLSLLFPPLCMNLSHIKERKSQGTGHVTCPSEHQFLKIHLDSDKKKERRKAVALYSLQGKMFLWWRISVLILSSDLESDLAGFRHTAGKTREAIPDILVGLDYLSCRSAAKVTSTILSLMHLLDLFSVDADHACRDQRDHNHCPQTLSCLIRANRETKAKIREERRGSLRKVPSFSCGVFQLTFIK